MQCPICNGSLALRHEEKLVEFKKEEFKIFESYYQCLTCNEKIIDTEMGEANINQLYNQYREKHNLLFPEEITQLREKYGFNKSKMSLALGWGENTYSLFEKGAMPSESHNSILRLIEEPSQFLKLLTSRRDLFNQKEIEKYESNVKELEEKGNRIESWIDLVWPHQIKQDTGYVTPNFDKFIFMVVFFISKKPSYKTKLNKLLFYSDFCHYKMHGKGLSGSRYRAIEFGPVPSEYDAIYNWLYKKQLIDIKEQYEEFGVTETLTAKKEFEKKLFNDSELATMKFINEKFDGFSSRQIKEFSHNEKAWIENVSERKIISYQEYAFKLNI